MPARPARSAPPQFDVGQAAGHVGGLRLAQAGEQPACRPAPGRPGQARRIHELRVLRVEGRPAHHGNRANVHGHRCRPPRTDRLPRRPRPGGKDHRSRTGGRRAAHRTGKRPGLQGHRARATTCGCASWTCRPHWPRAPMEATDPSGCGCTIPWDSRRHLGSRGCSDSVAEGAPGAGRQRTRCRAWMSATSPRSTLAGSAPRTWQRRACSRSTHPGPLGTLDALFATDTIPYCQADF